MRHIRDYHKFDAVNKGECLTRVDIMLNLLHFLHIISTKTNQNAWKTFVRFVEYKK